MKTTIQEVLFDLFDIVNNNPHLMHLKIEGFEEFDTLGEFITEQRMKMEHLEDCLE